MTAAQSASARTSVPVSEFCGYASDHAATDDAATTSTPPATGRVMSGAAPPTGSVMSGAAPPTTHRLR